MKLFRHLSAEDELRFRQWARAHYEPLSPIDGVWHPVVQDECAAMNAEAHEDGYEREEDRIGEPPKLA